MEMQERDSVVESLVAHILKNIRNKTAVELLDIHQKMSVSLQEMITAGLKPDQLDDLAIDCPDFLKEQLDQKAVSSEELLDGGMDEKLLDGVMGIQNPETPIPVPDPQEPPKQKGLSLSEIEELKKGVKEGKGSAAKIKNYLDRGLITPIELESWGMDQQIIDRVKEFYDVYFDSPEVSELPPLRKDASDVYFLGMPSSGKSTMLASLLAYSDRKSLVKPSQDNSFGTAYRKSIVKGVLTGYLPASTPGEFVNYIPIDFRYEKDKWQKMNFLDM